EIVQTYKLDRVLSTRRGDPKLAAAMARNDAKLRARALPTPSATRSVSFMQGFPAELLDCGFEELERLSRLEGREGDRARLAVRRLLSPAFDRPR
ncbi:unnamed protein product, partial [Prorocentrum cordatum]